MLTKEQRTARRKAFIAARKIEQATKLEIRWRHLESAGIGSVTDYTKLLEHYGFIRCIGKDSHQKVYMLIKDPGPVRPVTPEVKKKNVK